MTRSRHLGIAMMLAAALALAAGCARSPSQAPVIESTESEQAPQEDGEPILGFTGKVEDELNLSRADLELMGTTEKTIEHPKDGAKTYTGVVLGTLLEAAEPAEDSTLTFTATDAYSADVPVPEAEACADCMVAFHGDSLRLIMPGFGSSFWVKDLVSIEAK